MTSPPNALENKIKFSSTETFNIQINEQKFKLKISCDEKIMLFEINEENDFQRKEFNLYQSLEELIKIDKFFLQFDNLNEVFNSIKILILNKNLTIIKEDKLMKIKINNPTLNKEFFINIPLKEKDLKSEIDSLISYVISLNDKINNLEKTIKEIKVAEEKNQEEINFIKKKIKVVEEKNQEEINLIKKTIKEIKEKNQEEINLIKNEFNLFKKRMNMFKNSNIVQSDEIDLILSWFEKKPISFNLFLDSNIDGDSMNAFYNKCENKYPTMIFIKTTENLRFGGYTNEIWPKHGTKRDENIFVFSLNNKKKYKIINPENAIGAYQNNYFSFGCGNDLYLYNNCFTRGGGTFKSNYDIPTSYELNEGKEAFKVSIYEVYHVQY